MNEINIAILGFGVVGSGVAEILSRDNEYLSSLCKKKICLKHILDRRCFPDSKFSEILTDDINCILNDDETDTVVECMGGVTPAFEWCLESLQKHKNVVTSNKQLVAEKGYELLKAARENSVQFLFEASVGGGIPCLESCYSALCGSRIKKVCGILNGTTNYILSRMKENGLSYESALKEAQEKGYAEANPDADVLGTDSARKIAIFADIIWHKEIDYTKFPVLGINTVTSDDIHCADVAGYIIKLIASAEKKDNGIEISVMPTLVPKDSALAKISGCTNAVMFESDNNEPVFMSGAGAGMMATASAVVSDVVKVSKNVRSMDYIFWDRNDNEDNISVSSVSDYLYFSDSDCTTASGYCAGNKIKADIYSKNTMGCYIEAASLSLSEHAKLKSKLKYIGETSLGLPILK